MSTLPPLQHADAYIVDCGLQYNYFDGMSRVASREGVSAHIKSRHAGVCDNFDHGPDNFTNAWTMIADDDGNGWIQSGHERAWNTPLFFFSQAVNLPTNYMQTVFGTTLGYGENHQYWQQFVPSANRVRSNVDVTIFQTPTFNPLTQWGLPLSVQLFGETSYLENDILGYASSKTTFSSIQVQSTTTHQWSLIPCPYLSATNYNEDRWSVQGTSCTSFDIWTHSP